MSIPSRVPLGAARSVIHWLSQAVHTAKDAVTGKFDILDLDLDLDDSEAGRGKVCPGCNDLASPSYNTGWKFLLQGAELGCQICRIMTKGLSKYPDAPSMNDRSFISISVAEGAPVLLWLTNCRYVEFYTRPGVT